MNETIKIFFNPYPRTTAAEIKNLRGNVALKITFVAFAIIVSLIGLIIFTPVIFRWIIKKLPQTQPVANEEKNQILQINNNANILYSPSEEIKDQDSLSSINLNNNSQIQKLSQIQFVTTLQINNNADILYSPSEDIKNQDSLSSINLNNNLNNSQIQKPIVNSTNLIDDIDIDDIDYELIEIIPKNQEVELIDSNIQKIIEFKRKYNRFSHVKRTAYKTEITCVNDYPSNYVLINKINKEKLKIIVLDKNREHKILKTIQDLKEFYSKLTEEVGEEFYNFIYLILQTYDSFSRHENFFKKNISTICEKSYGDNFYYKQIDGCTTFIYDSNTSKLYNHIKYDTTEKGTEAKYGISLECMTILSKENNANIIEQYNFFSKNNNNIQNNSNLEFPKNIYNLSSFNHNQQNFTFSKEQISYDNTKITYFIERLYEDSDEIRGNIQKFNKFKNKFNNAKDTYFNIQTVALSNEEQRKATKDYLVNEIFKDTDRGTPIIFLNNKPSKAIKTKEEVIEFYDSIYNPQNEDHSKLLLYNCSQAVGFYPLAYAHNFFKEKYGDDYNPTTIPSHVQGIIYDKETDMLYYNLKSSLNYLDLSGGLIKCSPELETLTVLSPSKNKNNLEIYAILSNDRNSERQLQPIPQQQSIVDVLYSIIYSNDKPQLKHSINPL